MANITDFLETMGKIQQADMIEIKYMLKGVLSGELYGTNFGNSGYLYLNQYCTS